MNEIPVDVPTVVPARATDRLSAIPPWALAITAMLSVQLGSALSVNLIATVGPAGTAWLRLTAGALIFLAIVRPPLRDVRRADVPVLLALGVATGLISVPLRYMHTGVEVLSLETLANVQKLLTGFLRGLKTGPWEEALCWRD